MPLILTLATVAYWIFVITSKPRGQLVLIFGLVPTLVAASMCSLLIISSPGWGSWGAWVDIFPGYLLLTAVNCLGCFLFCDRKNSKHSVSMATFVLSLLATITVLLSFPSV